MQEAPPADSYSAPPTDAALGLARALAELGTELAADVPLEDAYDVVVRRAVELVPACEHCSLTVRSTRRPASTAAASSGIARLAADLQARLGEGPALAPPGDGDVVVADLRHETRWPAWSARAASLGLRSLQVVELDGDRGPLGALTFHAELPDAFDAATRALTALVATHAGAGLRAAHRVHGLRTAIESRQTIGVAQGVLAATYGLDHDRAFEVLRRYSNDTNTPVREVALHVVRHHALPGQEPPDLASSRPA